MGENYINEENSISLVEILRAIKKWFWFLVGITLLGGLALGLYAYFLSKPSYNSVGGIMIQVHETVSEKTNTVESQRLIQSTMDILTKIDIVQARTSENLEKKGHEISTGTIKANMVVSNTTGSLIIQISYKARDAEIAELVLNEIIFSLIEITNDDEYNMSTTLKGNISYLYVAPAVDISTNKVLLILVGLILGGIVGLVVVFTFELSNNTFKTADEIEREVNLQVIGQIHTYDVIKQVNKNV